MKELYGITYDDLTTIMGKKNKKMEIKMGIKRIIYLMLTYGYLFLIIFFSWLGSGGHIGCIISVLSIALTVGAILSMIGMLLSYIGKGKIPDIGDDIPFTFGFLTHKLKKIYYSDLGYFYIRSNSKKVIVYRQEYFIIKRLFGVRYNGNVDTLIENIKSKLDNRYREELENIKRKKELSDWDGYIDIKSKKELSDWDGYIDIKSKRDDKISKIIK